MQKNLGSTHVYSQVTVKHFCYECVFQESDIKLDWNTGFRNKFYTLNATRCQFKLVFIQFLLVIQWVKIKCKKVF